MKTSQRIEPPDDAKASPRTRRSDKPRRFERARPNRLWQTDMFTFVLKRQNRRVYFVAYMDDHSRFVVGWGLYSRPSTEMAIAALRAALESFRAPEELLTDNGPQYVTWRGKSRFSAACGQWGIRQIVSHPRRPHTLGKVERFWQTLWRDRLKTAIFADVVDARQGIAAFVDHYNFERPHRGIGGLTPADRYFGRAAEVKEALRQRPEEHAARLVVEGQHAEEWATLPTAACATKGGNR